MIWLKRFILMVQFLTRIPIPVDLKGKEEDFGKGMVFAPLVGVVLGGLLAGAYMLLRHVFPIHVTAVILVVLYIVLTGGLHLDGLGDTFDGLLSGRAKERILEIMRDSRVGTYAVLAVACVLLLDISLLAALEDPGLMPVLLLLPAAGRVGSLVGAGISTYARSGEGLGKSFVGHCGYAEAVVGSLLNLVVFYAVMGADGLILAVFSVVSAFVLTRMLGWKIGGVTGDILGAVCELCQVLFLLAAYILKTLY